MVELDFQKALVPRWYGKCRTAQSANVGPVLFKGLRSQRHPVNSKSIYPVQPRFQGSSFKAVSATHIGRSTGTTQREKKEHL